MCAASTRRPRLAARTSPDGRAARIAARHRAARRAVWRAEYLQGGTFQTRLITPAAPNQQLLLELYVRGRVTDDFDMFVAAGNASTVAGSLDASSEASLAAATYAVLEPVVHVADECTTSDGACAYYALYLSPCEVRDASFAVAVARRRADGGAIVYSLRYVTMDAEVTGVTGAAATENATQTLVSTAAAAFAHPLYRWRHYVWNASAHPDLSLHVRIGWSGRWAPRELLLLVRAGACPTLREYDHALRFGDERAFPLCPCGASNSTNAPSPPPSLSLIHI